LGRELSIGSEVQELFFLQDAILRMIHQFPLHRNVATRAKQRISPAEFLEQQLKRFARDDPKAAGIRRRAAGKDLRKLVTNGFVAEVAVQPVIADPLEPLGQDVLDHPADESQHGQGFVLDRLGLMVLVPIADGGAIVLLDPPHGDRRPRRRIWPGTGPSLVLREARFPVGGRPRTLGGNLSSPGRAPDQGRDRPRVAGAW
jgi:hypothetical protein